MSFSKFFLERCSEAIAGINEADIEAVARGLAALREREGRLFLIGSGGGAGHSSHAVCDFRKLCNIEAYAPYDNVSELTARVNDDGWDSTIVNWLKVSRFNGKDGLFVFSVGGGDQSREISVNLVRSVEYAKSLGASVFGVVGKDGGFTREVGDAVVVIPTVDSDMITPITEGFQAVIWHLLVSHPALQVNACKWESQSQTNVASRLIKFVADCTAADQRIGVKIFADGANRDAIFAVHNEPWLAGFTTNPTLMRKAGIQDYGAFARDVLSFVKDKPISFEVFSDEFAEMEAQAHEIASWGDNVYVKIPITNTRGESAVPLIGRLGKAGVKVNATALLTIEQVKEVLPACAACPAACISVFAGRIADTGVDPLPIMKQAVELLRPYPHVELIWASPREILNVTQAEAIGCHIITVTDDILKKRSLAGKDLTAYSLDTVKMFYEDARAAGYAIETRKVKATS